MDSEFLQKQELILAAARVVFLKYGYDKTSMNDIAAEAGLGKGTIYYYFDTKEDIYLQLLIKEENQFIAIINSEMAKATCFEDKLYVILVRSLEIYLTTADVFKQVWRTNMSRLRYKLHKFLEKKDNVSLKFFYTILEEGKKSQLLREDLDLKKFIEALIGMWFYFADKEISFNMTESSMKKIIEDRKTLFPLLVEGILKRG